LMEDAKPGGLSTPRSVGYYQQIFYL